MRRRACGARMRRIVSDGLIPSAQAASVWPRSSARTPERKTSAVVAEVHMTMGSASFQKSEIVAKRGTTKRKK